MNSIGIHFGCIDKMKHSIDREKHQWSSKISDKEWKDTH